MLGSTPHLRSGGNRYRGLVRVSVTQVQIDHIWRRGRSLIRAGGRRSATATTVPYGTVRARPRATGRRCMDARPARRGRTARETVRVLRRLEREASGVRGFRVAGPSSEDRGRTTSWSRQDRWAARVAALRPAHDAAGAAARGATARSYSSAVLVVTSLAVSMDSTEPRSPDQRTSPQKCLPRSTTF